MLRLVHARLLAGLLTHAQGVEKPESLQQFLHILRGTVQGLMMQSLALEKNLSAP